MKPFSIRCGECDAKLRVTRPEMLGHRVKCPRCGAKIAVPSADEALASQADTLSPDGLAPDALGPESIAADSAARREATRDVAAELAATRDAASFDEVLPDFGDIDSLLAAERKQRPASRTKAASSGTGESSGESPTEKRPPASAGAVPSAAAVDRQLLDPTAAWTSAETQTRRKLILWSAIGAAIALVAVGGLIVVVREMTKPGEVASNPSDDAAAETNDPSDSTPSPDDSATTDPAAADDSDPEQGTDGDSESTSDDPGADVPPGDALPNPIVPDSPPIGAIPSGPDPNPLAALLGNGSGDATSSDDAPPAGLGTDEARPFDVVLDDLASLGAIMEETPFDKARVMADQELRIAYRSRFDPQEVTVNRPKPRDPQLDRQIDLPLPGLTLPPMPLLKFVDFVSRTAGTPLQIDPEALVAVGATLESEVSFSGDETTLGQVVQQALAPIGLGLGRTGDVLVVGLPDAEVPVERTHDASGLSSFAAAHPDLLVEVIRSMVDPPSWAEGNGTSIALEGTQLKVVQRPATHVRIERFLAQWKGFVDGDDATIAATEAQAAQARERLTTRVSIEHLQEVPLVQLAREFSALAGIDILVDWVTLGEEGWSGDTTLSCNVEDLPLGLALDETLRPAGLTFRIVDARTLQITTRAALLDRPETRFHDVRALVAAGITPDDLAERLPLVFAAVGVQDPTRRFFYDPDAGLLIAALPQPQQRALVKFIEAWAKFASVPAAG
ncbi:MAG TPA: hypothetical protein PLI18_11875 [Pirellulaceae bacterium]|nr:hypothetical protein [Pirellulaceae bacterium]